MVTEKQLLQMLNDAVLGGQIEKLHHGAFRVGSHAFIDPEIIRSSEGFFTVERPTGRYILRPANGAGPNIILNGDEVDEIYLESLTASADLPELLASAKFEMTEFGPVPFIGDGYEAVYAYTTNECKAQGLIKIGMSSSSSVRGVVGRIKQQFGTSNPSPPEILLVMRVDDGFRTEQKIHGHLASKRMSGPGTEWFRVELQEIVAAYFTS